MKPGVMTSLAGGEPDRPVTLSPFELVMARRYFLTGCKSIRDVIFFPLLRAEGPIELVEKLRELDKA